MISEQHISAVTPTLKAEQTLCERAQSALQVSPFHRTVLDPVLLVCLVAMVAAASIRATAAMDEDLWWHLRTGDWIIQHHAVPVQDTFSSYSMGSPWVAYSWLFEVFVSKIYARWALRGVLAITTLLMSTCVAAAVALFSRYVTLVRAMALGTLVSLAMMPLTSPRPWLFTILFFIIELYFLLQARERGRTAWLWPLVPLFTLWANIHIQFVYGLAVIASFGLERPLAWLSKWSNSGARLHARWFWAVFVLCTIATLANPYGWQLYKVVHQYATEVVPLQMVQEMRALDFRSITDWAALLLACSGFFIQGISRNRCPLMLSLLTLSCWFGFRSGRDVWFLAIVSGLALASGMRHPEDPTPSSNWKQWAIAVPVSLTLAIAVLYSPGASESRLLEAASKRFPEKAAAYVENHGLPGPLYNSYGWGGYLMWRLPTMPVSIDGRANLHGDKHLQRWADTFVGKPDWATDPDLAKANTVRLERDSALSSILRSEGRYRLVYEDDLTSVFQPVTLNDNR